ncbi:MAG TPA: mandelate racemase/muconate lactonizing enzyme family protein [Dehalococcoidia bacterium]|jgi:galactonate dehydratase|nr:mandelate racemase/muconate lactonizing enzyme family protein [Dehalococcoidia bacterium]HJP27804.1 mandelate racemase/muconate lactonizing enzyme family protein [Dehalococcoidia bacterium]|tara:strand:+ start:19866 stop:20993 length:1128 start_codon:yes stop_codon:yes gene_type:complete
MKIAKIETFFVSRFLVVKVTTEDGTEGIGESCYWSYPKAAEATIHGFAEALIGMDATDIEHIWSYLWRYNSAFRGNSIGGAVSAIDMALWDIKGKRLQAPVWDLLGGKVRQKIRGIAQGIGGNTPEECAAGAKRVLDEGFSALKFTPMPRNWAELTYTKLIGKAIEMVEAVRETVGWDFDIGLEIHRNMQPHEAIAFCDEVAKLRPYFVEDPIVPDSVVAMGDTAAKMRLPLAVGERNMGIWEFREYAQLSKPAFFKPDIAVAGGITGTKKIATIAEAHHIKICPHNFQGPIATAACIALGISSPSWDVQESVQEEVPPRRDMTDEIMKLERGWYMPSEKPGLGVIFNEDAPAMHPFDPANSEPPIRDDGSVALK